MSDKASLLLDDLYKQKMVKLQEQKALSDKMNGILEKLNASSVECKRNLIAAIAVSQQSGYHEYYETPRELKELEEQKVLNSLARGVQKVHKELEALNSEIESLEASKKKAQQAQEAQVTSLSQWFEVYGRPKEDGMVMIKDQMTTFRPTGKIYGGTNHHRSFRTLSSTMKPGHLTR